jgi:hypothetical protein
VGSDAEEAGRGLPVELLLLMVAAVVPVEKILHEERDVLATLPQGGYENDMIKTTGKWPVGTFRVRNWSLYFT